MPVAVAVGAFATSILVNFFRCCRVKGTHTTEALWSGMPSQSCTDLLWLARSPASPLLTSRSRRRLPISQGIWVAKTADCGELNLLITSQSRSGAITDSKECVRTGQATRFGQTSIAGKQLAGKFDGTYVNIEGPQSLTSLKLGEGRKLVGFAYGGPKFSYCSRGIRKTVSHPFRRACRPVVLPLASTITNPTRMTQREHANLLCVATT